MLSLCLCIAYLLNRAIGGCQYNRHTWKLCLGYIKLFVRRFDEFDGLLKKICGNKRPFWNRTIFHNICAQI